MADVRKAQIRDEYISWLVLPKRIKKDHGLPTSKAAFAEWKGVAYQTLLRWEKRPEFQELLRQKQIEAGRQILPGSTVAKELTEQTGFSRPYTDPRALASRGLQEVEEADPHDGMKDLPSDIRWYEEVKRNIATLAKDGNVSAMEAYMKWWGKHHLEAELQEDERLLDMSDDELIEEFLMLAGPSRVARVLAITSVPNK